MSGLVTTKPTQSHHLYSIVAVHGLVGKDFPTWTPQKGSSLPSLLSEAVQRTSSDGVDPSTIVFQYAVKEGFMHTDSCAGIRKLALELLEEVYQSRVSFIHRNGMSTLMWCADRYLRTHRVSRS